MDKTASSLEGKIEREILINNYLLIVQLLEDALVGELKSKLEIIESEMDMRVESLISSIHDYRDECKKKLDLIKDDFKKYLWWLNTNSVSVVFLSRTVIKRRKISKSVNQDNEYLLIIIKEVFLIWQTFFW